MRVTVQQQRLLQQQEVQHVVQRYTPRLCHRADQLCQHLGRVVHRCVRAQQRLVYGVHELEARRQAEQRLLYLLRLTRVARRLWTHESADEGFEGAHHGALREAHARDILQCRVDDSVYERPEQRPGASVVAMLYKLRRLAVLPVEEPTLVPLLHEPGQRLHLHGQLVNQPAAGVHVAQRHLLRELVTLIDTGYKVLVFEALGSVKTSLHNNVFHLSCHACPIGVAQV